MDNHLHSKYSDGEDNLGDMVLTAIKLGYQQITFTDHVNRDSDWIDDYISEISELRKKYGDSIVINIGVEAKIINLKGDIDFNDHYRKGVDVVLAAIHRIPVGDEQYIKPSEVTLFNKKDIYSYMEETTYKVLRNPCVDILAHPFRLGSKEIFLPFFSERYCNHLRNIAIQESKYIEFNATKYNECVKQDYWKYPNFKVWVGSDSHSVQDMIKNNDLLTGF